MCIVPAEEKASQWISSVVACARYPTPVKSSTHAPLVVGSASVYVPAPVVIRTPPVCAPVGRYRTPNCTSGTPPMRRGRTCHREATPADSNCEPGIGAYVPLVTSSCAPWSSDTAW